MLRCNNNIYFDTTTNLTTHNPILPPGILIVDIELGIIKASNGIDRYADLPSSASITIGGRNIQSGTPCDNSIIWYNNATTLWEFATRGIFDTIDNIEGDPTVFPTYAIIIEKNESTGKSTGRVKFADGISTCSNLPWTTGINVYGEFSTGEIGKSIQWDGCQWIPMTFATEGSTPTADDPTGTRVLFDNGIWAEITVLPALESVTADVGEFATIYIGSAPTEPTSVTLTSPDGENLYVDGQKVWTQYNDGTGSGLDADTLAGRHYTDFATGPASVTSGHLVTFGASPNILTDSGYTSSSFATSSHTHDYSSTFATVAHSHASFPTLRAGDGTNYSNFATDGTFTLVGTARTWEDLRIEPTVKLTSPTTNNPTFEQWFTNGSGSRGVYLYSFEDGATEKEIHFTMQMPHQWAATAINIHVHWISFAAATAEVVKWGLEYTWAEPGATFGNTALVYATTTVQGDANYVQYKHYITQFASISPSSTTDGLSTIMIGRLFRNSNDAADTYASKAGLLYIDAHYEVDSMGSSTEYTK